VSAGVGVPHQAPCTLPLQRGHDYAELHGGPGVLSFARWYLALGLMRISARNRAAAMLTEVIGEFSPGIQLVTPDTTMG
jgi:hypothetical protein